ncbi:MAG: NfeD family protein [Gemmatimonadales bacterium]
MRAHRARCLLGALLLATATAAGAAAQTVVRIPVTGTIENGLAPFVARALREARERGAAAAVLDLDTPGGRVDAAERIADAVRAAEMPVYAFVNPRAFSAGALIALSAGGGIWMREGAVIGAATPVDGQGTKAPEKYVSAMRAEFRALAESQGLDPRIAEGMVDEQLDIPGIKPPGQLLTLSTQEAIRHGYAKGTAANLPALLAAVGMPDARVEVIDPNWAELVVRFLTNPLVSPLLLSLGMLGLIFEIKSGAFGVGGLVSLASLGLFFGSHVILGLAGWEELLLLGLGLVALALEVFVLPGFGVAGLLGLAAIGGATILALLGSAPTASDFLQAGAILAGSLVITAAVFAAWLRHLPNSTRFGGLLLKSSTQAAEGYISAAPRQDLVGKEGRALTDLRPAGTAVVNEERLDVVSEGPFIAAGTAVTVVRSEGYRHVVRERA